MAKTIKTGLITDKVNGITINTSIKCNSSNYTNVSSRTIKYIVMHYTGNKNKDTAKANSTYFKNGSRGSSAHFFVDNDSIYQSVELRDRAWHCGTSGTYYHGDCRNANSIGIEMCCTSGNYVVSKMTQINAAYLCAHLCEMIGVSAGEVDTYVLMHYSVTHKKCPAQYVANPEQWNQFKTWVKNILKTGKHTTTTSATTPVIKPTLKISANVKAIQTWLNKYYKTGLTTDGIYGKNTKKALIKAWQKEVGGLEVDGDFGPKSKAKAEDVILKKGKEGILVTILQATLTCQGYACSGGIDSDFGTGTYNAVKKLQKKHGLEEDGIVGKKSWCAMYE